MIEVFTMHKKDVHIADPRVSNGTVKRVCSSNAFDVSSVLKRLFGNPRITDAAGDNIGSNYGSPKAIVFDSSLLYQDIAQRNLNVSRTFGYNKHQKKNANTVLSNILFTMRHTSIRMGACSTL